jgi:ribonuclease BN (tRNA processing enzyme)
MVLLDCGEGTWFQLSRLVLNSYGFGRAVDTPEGNIQHCPPGDCAENHEVARKLKLIWISHPHADHHLGIITVICERYKILRRAVCEGQPIEPLLVIAPPSVLCFLSDYASNNPCSEFDRAYMPVSCRQIDPFDDRLRGDAYWSSRYLSTSYFDGGICSGGSTFSNSLDMNMESSEQWRSFSADHWSRAERILVNIGISNIQNVKVQHCFQSYGVCLSLSSIAVDDPTNRTGVKLVYSGDTRPCDRLVQLGQGATLLIHEATFEDSKSEEATSKKHSTISEALDVGSRMGAYRVILTHFSQRYPGTPPLPWFQADSDGGAVSMAETGERAIIAEMGEKAIIAEMGERAIMAFDFMCLTFKDLVWAPSTSKLFSVLFPSDKRPKDEGEDDVDRDVFPVISSGAGSVKSVGIVLKRASQVIGSVVDGVARVDGIITEDSCTCCINATVCQVIKTSSSDRGKVNYDSEGRTSSTSGRKEMNIWPDAKRPKATQS